MLPQVFRLNERLKIEEVKRGKKYTSTLFVLFWLKDDSQKPKFSFVCSKVVSGKAVVRNRIKRQMSEVIRKNLARVSPGFKVLLVARKEAALRKYEEIEKELLAVLEKEEIIK